MAAGDADVAAEAAVSKTAAVDSSAMLPRAATGGAGGYSGFRCVHDENPKFYSEPGFIRTLKSDVSFLLPTFTFGSGTATTN